jgi:pimeloyl-ACP methyl ester carboxylesterase
MALALRNGRRIHYDVAPAEGSGSEARAIATPVVLIPGLGGGARMFGTLPRRFARRGFPCITFDPVGVAPSSPHAGDYDLDEAARDLLAVLDDLELDACHLVGTSLGGKIALCATALAEERVQRVVLLASAAVATPRGRRVYRFFELLASRLDGPELGEVLATFLFGTTIHTKRPSVIDDIVRGMRLDGPTRELMVAQARSLHTFDGSARASSLTCPCLCLAGAEDTLTGIESIAATAALIPNCHFEVIPSAGHTLLLEAPTVFDQITSFLRA